MVSAVAGSEEEEEEREEEFQLEGEEEKLIDEKNEEQLAKELGTLTKWRLSDLYQIIFCRAKYSLLQTNL